VNLESLVLRYGLAAVFIGSAFEGDFTLILAGVVAHLGYFPFPLAVAAGVPIVASRQLLDEEGLTSEDLARARSRDRKRVTTRL
jgi:cation transporter-like permease